MVSLQVQFLERTPGTLNAKMTERVKRLRADIDKAASTAAATATTESRSKFTYERVSDAPARRGRPTSGGKFGQKLKWAATRDGDVEFDTANLDTDARYWVIQEIGTGQRAQMRTGGQKRGRGRPKKGDQGFVTVKSQRGRRISRQLAFGTGPRGRYTPPGAATGQNIYFRRQLKGVPLNAPAIVIHREIEGKHFVRDGGKEGFREYRTSVLSAARRAFAGHPYRP